MNYAKSYIDCYRAYAACLANDKFCQRLIDLAAVMDGKVVLDDTLEE